MKEQHLIDVVRAHPVLYDYKHKQYRNQALRKDTWDQIGQQLGTSGDYCKESWNKLRNAYTNALSRRKKERTGESTRKMQKWTYEDEMSFLYPYTCQKNSGRSSVEIGAEETTEHYDGSLTDADDVNQCSATNSTAHDNFTLFNTDHLSDEDESTTFQIEPKPHSSISISTTQARECTCTMNELVSVMKNNSRMLLKQFKNQNRTPNNCNFRNCSHDEDELYFLSLAKFVKKLNPAERIRVKAEVSQTIFQAEFRSLQNERPQPCTSTFLNANSVTPEEYFSETMITHPKIERE